MPLRTKARRAGFNLHESGLADLLAGRLVLSEMGCATVRAGYFDGCAAGFHSCASLFASAS